jgi:hypothetical protein
MASEAPMDAYLRQNGWEETGGIALWTHPARTDFWVDTNAEVAAVYPIRRGEPFNNSPDDFHDFCGTPEERAKALAGEREP